MLTPQQFGAKGDGSDDSVSLQAWLDALADYDRRTGTYGANPVCHGYVPRGLYCYSRSLSIHSDTCIDGAGKSVARFRSTNVAAVIGNARMRWRREVDPDDGGPPLDHDISISNVGFEGDPAAEVPGSFNFMTFIGVDGLLLRDARLQNRRSDLVVLHNYRNVTLDTVEMANWGKLDHPTPGDGRYVGGCAVFCWLHGERLRIVNCDVHDGAGGLWLQDATETILTGTRVSNTTEFDVVGVGRRSVWAVNIFGETVRVDVSGHSAELHGEEFIYGFNVHAGADGSNVYASNLRNAIVAGNLCLRPGPGAAAVMLASHGAWAGVGDKPPECVSIDGNLCCDEERLANNAVLAADLGGGPMAHVVVTDNNSGDAKQWQDRPVRVERKGVTAVHN